MGVLKIPVLDRLMDSVYRMFVLCALCMCVFVSVCMVYVFVFVSVCMVYVCHCVFVKWYIYVCLCLCTWCLCVFVSVYMVYVFVFVLKVEKLN